MLRKILSFVLVFALGLMLTGSAEAITFGTEDTEGLYPNVGGFVMTILPGQSYGPFGEGPHVLFSGILIHPRVILSCGHGVPFIERLIARGICDPTIKFSLDYDPLAEGATQIKVVAWHLHPMYYVTSGFANRRDTALFILEDPVTDVTPANLPTENYLWEQKMAGDLNVNTKLTAVGYGMSLEFPPPRLQYEDQGKRRYVETEFRGLTKNWLMASMNPALGLGGTAYGDSGGPSFYTDPQTGDLIVTSTTWTGDPLCIELDQRQRVDLPDVLEFINSKIAELP